MITKRHGKATSVICFPLRRKRHNSSSWLRMLSMLENKDGTHTIEMILKSTVLLQLCIQLGFKWQTIVVCLWDKYKLLLRMRIMYVKNFSKGVQLALGTDHSEVEMYTIVGGFHWELMLRLLVISKIKMLQLIV